MEKLTFPWLNNIESEKKEIKIEKEQVENSLKFGWKNWVKPYTPVLGLLVVLLGFYFFQSTGSSATALSPELISVDVLISGLPQKKGTLLRPEALRLVPLRKKTLSRAQLLDLVAPEHLDKLHGKVRLKKDLSPSRPLFWSDVNFAEITHGNQDQEIKTFKVISPLDGEKKL